MCRNVLLISSFLIRNMWNSLVYYISDMKIRFTSMVIILMALMPFTFDVSAQVVTYPAPPGLITSQDFTIKADGKPV